MKYIKISMLALLCALILNGCGTSSEPGLADNDNVQVMEDEEAAEMETSDPIDDTVSYHAIETTISGLYNGLAKVVSEDDIFFIVPTDETLRTYLKSFGFIQIQK